MMGFKKYIESVNKSPISFLLDAKKGDEVPVWLPDSDTDRMASKGWRIHLKGSNFLELQKQPSMTEVGGRLVVPNNVFMNWKQNELFNKVNALRNVPAQKPSEEPSRTVNLGYKI
jgi:hypothetical protein